MAKQMVPNAIEGTEKEFLDLFNALCYSRTSWQVWSDLMSVMACSLSNFAEINQERRDKREKEYQECIKRLGGSNEIPAKMFAIITMALEKNPDQDFLGEMYMQLNMGSHWHGQFFTPYCVCKAMSEITVCDKPMEELNRRSFISVCDPSCGAGATLIAAANTFREHGVNYQRKVLFVGQDIDRVVAQMCYIQLSLLGCPGYICVANTLTNPITGPTLEPFEKEGQEFWYTPFYSSDYWTIKRITNRIEGFMRNAQEKQEKKKEEYIFFFDFEKEEKQYGRAE